MRKHLNLARCIYLKSNRTEPPTENAEMRANIAKAQYVKIGGKLEMSEKPKEPLVQDENSCDEESEVKRESCDNQAGILAVDIKEEPLDIEYFDESQPLNMSLPQVPYVMLKRLEPEVIQRWTRIKAGSYEMQAEDMSEDSQWCLERNFFEIDAELPQISSKKPDNHVKKKVHRSETSLKPIIFKRRSKCECDWCGEKMRKKMLMPHFCAHKRTRKAQVDLRTCNVDDCRRVFASTYLLMKHKYEIHGLGQEPRKKFACDLCSEGFSSSQEMSIHLNSSHSDQVPTCVICLKSFISSTTLKTHLKFVHLDVRRFICCVCAKAFHTKHKLNDHEQRHGELQTCDLCGKLVRNMKSHKEWHLKEPKQSTYVNCPHCDKRFTTYLIQPHIDRIHLKTARNGIVYRCDNCAEQFTRNDDLIR